MTRSLLRDGVRAKAWANYQAREWWVVTIAFTQMHESLHFKAESSGLLGIAQAGNDPSHQAHLRPTPYDGLPQRYTQQSRVACNP